MVVFRSAAASYDDTSYHLTVMPDGVSAAKQQQLRKVGQVLSVGIGSGTAGQHEGRGFGGERRVRWF